LIREILAQLLIILLVAGAFWNVHTIEDLSNNIQNSLHEAEKHLLSGNREAARQAVDFALKTWQRAENYTHIFIRHPEIDSCTDIFYDLKEALSSAEIAEIQAISEKLCSHLQSIADMEKPKIGNIL